MNGSKYFRGDRLGVVDIAWLPLLHRFQMIKDGSGYDFLKEWPKLKAWQKALMQTGIAEKSVSSDFDEVFNGFYLSDMTYLGRGADAESNAADAACGDCSC